jgi:EAL domain-containing protein (putative c-di-GMP-specific phosphodiesterase class I)
VETATNFDVLDHAGCDQLQGDHISKPVPAAGLETFMLAWGDAA